MPTLQGLHEVLSNQNKAEESILSEILFEQNTYNCLFHEKFIVIQMNEHMYCLSFNINEITIQQVAEYTNLITLYFYDMIYIYDDCFYTSSDEILFGKFAYDKLESTIHDRNGNIKCSLCGNIVSKKQIDKELNYCIYCRDFDIPNATFH